jgi:hypothetical protein
MIDFFREKVIPIIVEVFIKLADKISVWRLGEDKDEISVYEKIFGKDNVCFLKRPKRRIFLRIIFE